jgi:hypothetical protein
MSDPNQWWTFVEGVDDHHSGATEPWWSMAGADGVEAVCIPLYSDREWGKCDSQLVGQVIMMFARRRVVYHKMGIVEDPLLSQSEDALSYWEELVNEGVPDHDGV